MPLGSGVHHRVTRRGGRRIRLALRGDKVVETTALPSRRKVVKRRKP